MPYQAVIAKTPDGRICGKVPGVLGTTVYAATEEECVAALKVALRRSISRAYRTSRGAFSGLGQRRARR